MKSKRILALLLALLMLTAGCAGPAPAESAKAPVTESLPPAPAISEEPDAPAHPAALQETPTETPTAAPEQLPTASLSPLPTASAAPRPSAPPPAATPSPSSAPAVEPSPTAAPTVEPAPAAVTVTVTAAGGTLLSRSVAYTEGMTAYDALQSACNAAGIALSASGSGASVYIRGIGAYQEFAQGAGSGWLYYVNGVSPSRSCGGCALAAGDSVRFSYTTDYGRDLQ